MKQSSTIPHPSSPRQLAVMILNRVDAQGAFAEPLLDHYLTQQTQGDRRNSALVTQIVFGTLRMRGYLDWLIRQFYHGNLETMASGLKNILRSALYQIFFMDRLPPYAVVNEAVKITESTFRGRGALVNAVLRHALRARENIQFPSWDEDPIQHLSVVYSHPSWLAEKWFGIYGKEETVDLCKANNAIPPVTLRVNTLKTSREKILSEMCDVGMDAAPTPYSPDGIRIVYSEQPLRDTPWLQEGSIHIQDEGSQLIARFLDPRRGETILDLCAGTGGKTTHLAALMGNGGRIVALDNLPHKLEALQALSSRMGTTCIETVCRDGREQPPEGFTALFDRVLVDAPCTGTGTMRRNPEIKWRLAPAEVKRTVVLQRELLDSAVRYLRKGGCLVYSTCSLLPEENEAQVRSFLTLHAEFHLDKTTGIIPADCISADGFLQTFPHRHNMDGFFAARMIKIS
ncbi:MAG: 16S rRNA (cytosine(967)-C(5))-methyltransferase RsmB [Syntrophaceae bacterium]|nr:16S rRNA (cytosine(967)-C(5))-methyltransferase RsmB [Syntrophaceae bacterium]